jgi:hypothetical protein
MGLWQACEERKNHERVGFVKNGIDLAMEPFVNPTF